MSERERELIAEEINILLILVDMIIPASEDFALPSASDPQIFADFVNTAQRHRDKVGTLYVFLRLLRMKRLGANFAKRMLSNVLQS